MPVLCYDKRCERRGRVIERMIENIALFDMDGTLFDYDGALTRDMNKLRSPDEPLFVPPLTDDSPEYLKARADLIRGYESWWENLSKLELGWQILEVAKQLEYSITILTQGPRKNPASWSGKKKCIDKHLGEDMDITVTRNKGLVYGRVLVDDYPKYVEKWLAHRPRGQVIMPAGPLNLGYENPRVIRYDGKNLEQVRGSMERAKLIKSN